MNLIEIYNEALTILSNILVGPFSMHNELMCELAPSVGGDLFCSVRHIKAPARSTLELFLGNIDLDCRYQSISIL